MADLIQLSHLSKKFGDRTILHDINLTVTPGEIVGNSLSSKTPQYLFYLASPLHLHFNSSYSEVSCLIAESIYSSISSTWSFPRNANFPSKKLVCRASVLNCC